MKDLLISVKPRFAELLKKGLKTIELRKSTPRQKFDKILIYNTGTQQIELMASVDNIRSITLKHKENLYSWSDLFKETMGLTVEEMIEYLGNKDVFYYIFLTCIEKIKPISLEEMQSKGIRPPQGYLYVESDLFNYKLI